MYISLSGMAWKTNIKIYGFTFRKSQSKHNKHIRRNVQLIPFISVLEPALKISVSFLFTSNVSIKVTFYFCK